MAEFKYTIDIATPDEFIAHVEDNSGAEVFEIASYEHLQDIIDERYMHNEVDIVGLKQYLVDKYIICDNDMLYSNVPLVIG